LDTYKTFGCESGVPTFRYSLLDGVKDGYLVNPYVIDARTDVTTKLLSERGFAAVPNISESGDEVHYLPRDFEKRFFSPDTNRVFCEALIRHGQRDPITGEFGKTLVFAASQRHAAVLTQCLNEIASKVWPGKYQSDFALQVTSEVRDAQDFTRRFTNDVNNLSGQGNFDRAYKTSKTRICVTVGMMTTGYDCTDLLNIALMRPVYSPSEFVQIKGRGTRLHHFAGRFFDDKLKAKYAGFDKKNFYFFDYFANCEFFEEKFNYDEKLKLPQPGRNGGRTQPEGTDEEGTTFLPEYVNTAPDTISNLNAYQVGEEGMKIDRMLYDRFEAKVLADPEIREQVEQENWQKAAEYVAQTLFNKPSDYFSVEKLNEALEKNGLDRKVTLTEILQKIFGLIDKFKTSEEVVDEQFNEFELTHQDEFSESDRLALAAIKYFFEAYATDETLRKIIDGQTYVDLNTNESFDFNDYLAVPEAWREKVPEYIKRFVE
jgi:type I restriction enzyme R subunit